MRDISRQTEDSIAHYMEIQSNNTFAYEEDKFRSNLVDFSKITVDITRVFGKTTFLSGFFSGMATLLVYGLGGFLLIQQGHEPSGITIGAIFVMIRALATIIRPVNSLIDYSQRYQEARVKFQMVLDYLACEKRQYLEDKLCQ